MSVSIKPLEDRIVIKQVEAEQTTASGLVIPDTAKEKPQEGEVVAVGPGRIDDNGNRVPSTSPSATACSTASTAAPRSSSAPRSTSCSRLATSWRSSSADRVTRSKAPGARHRGLRRSRVWAVDPDSFRQGRGGRRRRLAMAGMRGWCATVAASRARVGCVGDPRSLHSDRWEHPRRPVRVGCLPAVGRAAHLLPAAETDRPLRGGRLAHRPRLRVLPAAAHRAAHVAAVPRDRAAAAADGAHRGGRCVC